jgi:hypothetical protein
VVPPAKETIMTERKRPYRLFLFTALAALALFAAACKNPWIIAIAGEEEPQEGWTPAVPVLPGAPDTPVPEPPDFALKSVAEVKARIIAAIAEDPLALSDPGHAIPLPPLAIAGSFGDYWPVLLQAIKDRGAYVALDLTYCGMDAASGGKFDPGTYNTGEPFVAALTFPWAATSLAVGYSISPFRFFTALETVSGVRVDSVSYYAFHDLAALKTASFPEALFVGSAAFSGCTALETVDLPKAVNFDGAFSGCTSLTTVYFPEAEHIGVTIFQGCTLLETAILPKATLIENWAFGGCTSLETADFPEARIIGQGAFADCTGLETVNLPEVVTIYDTAFRNCTALETVSFPKVENIEREAFLNCTGLTSVSIPASLTSIDGNPFRGCTNLTGISVDAGSQSFSGAGGMLMDKTGTALLAWPSAAVPVNFTTVTSVGDDALRDTAVTSVDLPAAETIGEYAFNNCTALASVTLLTATGIGTGAFQGCSGLISVSIPAAAGIGMSAFAGCSYLTSVSLPAAETIDNYAFQSCFNLATVEIPAAETIGTSAFQSCYLLTTVIIGPDCDIAAADSFPNGFKTYYDSNGKIAGTYTWGGTWSFTP